MRLTSKMAHICLSFFHQYPEIRKGLDHYFENNNGRYGYHASQLVKKHRIPKDLAARVSPMFNMWEDQLLVWREWLPEKVRLRLSCCTSAFGKCHEPRTCESKLCPWCRAITILRFQGYLASRRAQGCDVRTYPVSEPLSVPPTRPGAVLSARNVVLLDNQLVLKVACFYPKHGFGMSRDVQSVSRDVLRYDFGLLETRHRDEWLRLTRRLRLFTRSLKV